MARENFVLLHGQIQSLPKVYQSAEGILTRAILAVKVLRRPYLNGNGEVLGGKLHIDCPIIMTGNEEMIRKINDVYEYQVNLLKRKEDAYQYDRKVRNEPQNHTDAARGYGRHPRRIDDQRGPQKHDMQKVRGKKQCSGKLRLHYANLPMQTGGAFGYNGRF